MQVTFIDKQELAPQVWLYRFKPKSTLDFTPGQYARFTFPFHVADPHDQQHRTFSFVSHPNSPELSILTRLEKPYSVFKQPLSQLESGDIMHIDEPHGDTILPRLDTVPLVFVAQGIALASYIAMLQEIADQKLTHPTTLLWAHRADDAPLIGLMPGGVPLQARREFTYPEKLTGTHIAEYDTPDSLIYLSGGQHFVESLGAELEASGIPRERIIYDYYEGYAEL